MIRYLLCIAALNVSASATVIYTDFSAGNGYNGGNSWTIGGSSVSVVATSFSPTATATLDSIDVAVFSAVGGPNNTYSITLAANNAGEPGSTIESFTGLTFPVGGGIVTVNSASHPLLSTGTTYWLYMADGAAPDNAGGWYWNNATPLVTGIKFEADTHPTTWFTNSFQASPVFDVNGSVATPEPSALWLVASGVVLLAGGRAVLPASRHSCRLTAN